MIRVCLYVWVFTSFTCLICDVKPFLQTFSGHKEYVRVRPWGLDNMRVQRSATDQCTYKNFLRFMLTLNGTNMMLNLERSPRRKTDTPVYAMVDSTLHGKGLKTNRTIVLYQDPNRPCAMVISCMEDGSYTLDGWFYHEGDQYRISAEADDGGSVVHFVQKVDDGGLSLPTEDTAVSPGETSTPSLPEVSGGRRSKREVSDIVAELPVADISTGSTTDSLLTTSTPCQEDKTCCIWKNSKRKCCVGAECCQKPNWASGTKCYETCCGSEIPTATPTVSTTESSPTTSIPCMEDKECCVWRNGKAKCCVGAECCQKPNWASGTQCYETCCGSENPTATPTVSTTESSPTTPIPCQEDKKCCVWKNGKAKCCIGAECCQKPNWASGTPCYETCCGSENSENPTAASTISTTESSPTTPIPCQEDKKCCVWKNGKAKCCVGAECCQKPNWASGTQCYETCCGYENPTATSTLSTTESSPTTPIPCQEDKKCCVWKNGKAKCCVGAECCQKPNWASGTQCYETCCGSESPTATSTLSTTESSPTTPIPCQEDKKCCVWRNSKAKCCVGAECCQKPNWASGTQCYETCCGSENPTATSTISTPESSPTTPIPCQEDKKCCVWKNSKAKCCVGAECCQKPNWASGTQCFKTCCGADISTITTAPVPCIVDKRCCRWQNSKRRCCTGTECCLKPQWASDTVCYQTCCPPEPSTHDNTSVSPYTTPSIESTYVPTANLKPQCIAGTCCEPTLEGMMCCQGVACCGQDWANKTTCAQTCCDPE